jgi:hypothetical protein
VVSGISRIGQLRGICTGLGFVILDLAVKILMAVKCYLCEGLGYEKFRS